MVALVHASRSDAQRQQRDRNQPHIAQDARQANDGAHDVKVNPGLPEAAHQHQRHDDRNQGKVCLAIKTQALGVGRGICWRNPFALVIPAVNHIKNHQQADDQKQCFWQQRGDRPEKSHAFQKPQKQRRVAQRCKSAADVGHQKNKKHHDMRLTFAVVIGANQRANQQHRSACGAHEACQHRANRQNTGV